MDLGLKGKVAVVTGGTAGIGLATAQAFIDEGAYVAVCGRHFDLLKTALKQLGNNAFGCQTDMTNENEVYGFARQVNDHFGHIDIWVNNVGASFARKDTWYTGKEIDAHYAVNFKSVVVGSQAAIPYLEKQGGVIINVSSLAARCATSGRATLYGPMKAAVVNYTNTLAGEVAAKGIRVLCIMPGFTLTPLVAQTIAPEELNKQVKSCLLRRPAQPEEIAGPIVFLASQQAAYMDAETIEVSGGRNVTLNPGYSYND